MSIDPTLIPETRTLLVFLGAGDATDKTHGLVTVGPRNTVCSTAGANLLAPTPYTSTFGCSVRLRVKWPHPPPLVLVYMAALGAKDSTDCRKPRSCTKLTFPCARRSFQTLNLAKLEVGRSSRSDWHNQFLLVSPRYNCRCVCSSNVQAIVYCSGRRKLAHRKLCHRKHFGGTVSFDGHAESCTSKK